MPRQETGDRRQALAILRAAYDQMITHCLEKWPHEEACGYLAATADGTVSKVYPMTNVEHSSIGYSMDSTEQLRVEKEMRANHQRWVGIYHSHTATEARPSSVDVRHAISPDVSYVIVSLQDGDRPDVKSYRIDGTAIRLEPYVID